MVVSGAKRASSIVLTVSRGVRNLKVMFFVGFAICNFFCLARILGRPRSAVCLQAESGVDREETSGWQNVPKNWARFKDMLK